MTFDEFKKFQEDFCTFLENATVNLGRKTAKTRQEFIDTAVAKFNAFGENFIVAEICPSSKDEQPIANPMDDRILCIKPIDPRKALDIGKGVHAMTPSESMRADEQLNRSPYTKEKKNE